MPQTTTETVVRDANGHASADEEEEEEDISIQRDFFVPPDCDGRLKPFGARLLADQVFADEFYDTPDYALSLQGITLRLRDGQLELSHGASAGGQDPHPLGVLRGPDDVAAFLHSRSLLREDAPLHGDVREALKRENFQVFATPSISRRVYGIPQGELLPAKISFEVSDLGHSVGEIEVSVDHRDELPAALKTIDVLSQRLGFKSVTELK
ncbi:hypothetical protein BV898_13263 [Hypsibius exemplaris]|uniref:CYTH domain-containing protein n=1 Tax=Hypsibius exemplaris TaxID=2072580 RepID=A0A1W0WBD0_HYPEX|nr:hypothetical protein BV898_13263 [Hypsibius exemplaris]